MGEFAIGQPVPRFEDPRLLQGGGRYVDDMVLPGMAFGYVLRSPHAHARIRKIDTAKAKAAPGVLAVLTGDDWQGRGLGRPAGARRAQAPRRLARLSAALSGAGQGPGALGRRLRRLRGGRDLAPGDRRGRADRGRLRAAAAPSSRPRDAVKPGAPLVWDDCPNNICFVQIDGDKAATDAAFAKAAHVVKHHFVINRVTAATMEPRGCIGDYKPTERPLHHLHHAAARASRSAPSCRQYVLKVPENKIRVVAGDIGGSFGMKSAVYNEVALVLLASKLTGRPVKWMSTRSEAFLCDAQARDNVTDAELALDKDGNFLGLRVKIIAAIGAYLQVGMPAFTGNLGTLAGVYRTPAIACRRHRGVHPHQSGAALSRQRPAGGRLCDRAHGRSRRRRAGHRSGRAAAEQLHSARAPCRSRPALTFTYDCGEFEKSMDMALEARRRRGLRERARAESRKHGKLRGIGISNTIERAAAAGFEGAEIRFDRSGTVTLFSGSVNQGQGHETIVQADRLRPARHRSGRRPLHPGRHRPGVPRRRHRRLALGHAWRARRSTMAAEKIIDQGARQIAAHMLKVDVADVNFADGMFSSPKTNQTLTIKEVAKAAHRSGQAAEGHGASA